MRSGALGWQAVTLEGVGVADREEAPQLRLSKDLAGITGPKARIDRKRFSPAMANPPNGHRATKNPGGLAGRTGANQGSAWRLERAKPYSILAVLS